jgi:hypothetical protein
MKTTIRQYSWHETEAADAFVASAESRGTDTQTLQTVARLADDTDEAIAIWEFIAGLRQAGAR